MGMRLIKVAPNLSTWEGGASMLNRLTRIVRAGNTASRAKNDTPPV